MTNKSTGAAEAVGLFGKTADELRQILADIRSDGLLHFLFDTPTIDNAAVDKYNDAIKEAAASGANMAEKQQIMKAAMEDTNKATARLIKSTGGAIVETDALTAAQKSSTLAARIYASGLKMVSVAGNMITFTAISKGIAFAAKCFDDWIHRVERANEAMSDAVSEYESAKSGLARINSELETQNQKIEELLSKDKLTYTEKGQLEELQAITKELLFQQDIEQRRAQTASKEAADSTVEAYQKQYGNYKASREDIDEMLQYDIFPAPQSENDISGNIAAYIRAQELLARSQEQYQAAKEKGEDTTWLSYDVQSAVDLTADLSEALDKNLSDLQEKRIALEDEYKKAVEKQNLDPELLTSSEKEILETYDSIYDSIKMIYKYTNRNDWNNMEFNTVFHTEGIEKTKDELIAMAQTGKLTPQTLAVYKNLNAAIQDSELFLKDGETAAEAFCDELYACAEAENSLKNSDTLIPPLFDSFADTDLGDRIQHITDLFNEGSLSYREYFDALQSEIRNFDASGFTNSIEDMSKAAEQFFTDSVRQTASGLSSLIKSFDRGKINISEYLDGYLAIGETLGTLTDSLQDNSDAWNEHGESFSDTKNAILDSTQEKLQSAMSVIESYQDSIYALEQIMTGTVPVGTDEVASHADVIAEDLYHIIQSGGEMADVLAETLGTTTNEIAQNLTENVSNQEIACQAIMANTNSAISEMAESVGKLFDTLGRAISNFKVDISFGIKSIDKKKVNIFGKEIELPEINFELGASGESLSDRRCRFLLRKIRCIKPRSAENQL